MKNAIFLIVLMLSLAGCVTQANEPANSITDGKWEITVNSVSVQEEGLLKPYIAPPNPGNQFVIVNLSIENISPSKEKYMYRQVNRIKDGGGKTYDVDFEHQLLLLENGEGFVEIYELRAGGKRSGSIVFQVPKDSSQLKFLYNRTTTNQEYSINLEPLILPDMQNVSHPANDIFCVFCGMDSVIFYFSIFLFFLAFGLIVAFSLFKTKNIRLMIPAGVAMSTVFAVFSAPLIFTFRIEEILGKSSESAFGIDRTPMVDINIGFFILLIAWNIPFMYFYFKNQKKDYKILYYYLIPIVLYLVLNFFITNFMYEYIYR